MTLRGLQGRMPTPSLEATSSTSHSGSLHNRLYLKETILLSSNKEQLAKNLLLLQDGVLGHPLLLGETSSKLELPPCHVASSNVSHLQFAGS